MHVPALPPLGGGVDRLVVGIGWSIVEGGGGVNDEDHVRRLDAEAGYGSQIEDILTAQRNLTCPRNRSINRTNVPAFHVCPAS